MAVLIIDGQTMPTPKYNGLNVSYSKIWSSDTGRNNVGTMNGTIVAIKKKVEAEFPPMKSSEANNLREKINSITTPYPKVKCIDESGVVHEFTSYSGDISFSLLGKGVKNGVVGGAKVSIIER